MRKSTLGDVLGVLHRNRISGALRLDELGAARSRRHAIHWLDGLIYDVETPLGMTPFAEFLRAQARSQASRAKASEARPAAPRFDRVAFERALELQRRERLEALFGLDHATLSFSAMQRSWRRLRPLDPREFLHGRPRSRDRSAPAARATPTPAERARREALRELGLGMEAQPAEVAAAFKRLARRYHPDLHPAADEPTRAALSRQFVRIALAYHTLRA